MMVRSIGKNMISITDVHIYEILDYNSLTIHLAKYFVTVITEV